MALSKLTDIRKSLSVEVEDLQVNGITTFTGSVSIGGTLTYQDVTNVDSVGIITAQAGINVSGGTGTFAGDVLIADKIVHTGDTDTAIRFHANDTVSVETGGSQQVTIGSNVNIISGELVIPDTIRHRSDANTKIRFPANDTFSVETAGSERLRITSGGAVGIGTDNPASKLTIAEDGASTNAELAINYIGSGTRTAAIRFQRGGTNFGYIAGGNFMLTSGAADDLAIAPVSGKNLLFGIGSSEKLRIASDGKIGINNTSPTFAAGGGVHLKGSGTDFTSYRVTASSNTGVDFSQASDGKGYVYNRDNADLIIGTNNTERLRINSAGNVMVGNGVDTPYAPLHVYAENGRGLNAIFGKGFVDSANYHYDDANIQLNGRDVDGNDTGSGIEFNSRNTGNSNWLHGAITQDRSGNLNFINGGAGTSVGTEKLRISSAGYVTKPSNPMFKVVRTTNQTISSNGWHVIQYNSDTATGCFDVGGHFSTSNHRFTAPVTGYYQFGLNQRIDGGNGDYFRVAFTVNGGGLGGQYPYGHAIYRDNDGFSYYTFSITSLIYLTAGQYVRAEAYSSSDTSWTLQDESQFYGYLVG